MQNTYLHNDKAFISNKKKPKFYHYQNIIKKKVNINSLLNRVKLDEKNEKKKLFIFSLASCAAILAGIIIIF